MGIAVLVEGIPDCVPFAPLDMKASPSWRCLKAGCCLTGAFVVFDLRGAAALGDRY